MNRKYHLTTVLIIAVFFLGVFLMVRVFTCIKAVEFNDFLLGHFYGDQRDSSEDWNYRRAYLDEKYPRFFIFSDDIYNDASFFRQLTTAERISTLMPKTQMQMFLTYHDGEYLYNGNYNKLSTEEEIAARIALTSWNNITRKNKAGNRILYLLTLFVGIGIVKFRQKLRKDMESEEDMANTLSKGLSYEMVEPLNGLREALEEWKNAGETERSLYSGRVIAEVDQMDEMIQNMLKLRDFEAGNIDLHCEDVNLYYLTMAVLKHLDPIMAKKLLTVQVDSPTGEECIVKADPQIMKIVLGNLIMKAADYSSRRVKIIFLVEKSLQFQVLSDDHQVSNEEADSIWKDYTLQDDCMADQFGSNGVGLATVGRMLDAHKAKYGCEPDQRGTLLWFEMKRIKNHE